MAWYVDWISFARVGTNNFSFFWGEKKSDTTLYSIQGGEFLE